MRIWIRISTELLNTLYLISSLHSLVSFLCTLVVVVVILSVVLGALVVLTLPPLELENPVTSNRRLGQEQSLNKEDQALYLG